jgi:hypothetical protein
MPEGLKGLDSGFHRNDEGEGLCAGMTKLRCKERNRSGFPKNFLKKIRGMTGFHMSC